MKDIRLNQLFDGVFVHDAIGYMTTRKDLLRALRSALFIYAPGLLFETDDRLVDIREYILTYVLVFE